MGRKPVITLAGALLAGFALAGCQNSPSGRTYSAGQPSGPTMAQNRGTTSPSGQQIHMPGSQGTFVAQPTPSGAPGGFSQAPQTSRPGQMTSTGFTAPASPMPVGNPGFNQGQPMSQGFPTPPQLPSLSNSAPVSAPGGFSQLPPNPNMTPTSYQPRNTMAPGPMPPPPPTSNFSSGMPQANNAVINTYQPPIGTGPNMSGPAPQLPTAPAPMRPAYGNDPLMNPQ